MRALMAAVFGFVLRVFFRRIEILGQEKVPTEGPVIFVLNHPNALVDPAFMLCFSPRPVSFIAKSTLFSMPIIGAIVRGFDCLPAYRRHDKGVDPSKNKETFVKARELLSRGGSLALFPEGTSHSDPSLRPLKTGAARIALGSAAMLSEAPQVAPLKIIPAGLFYTGKTTFRSAALLSYGEPFTVPVMALDENFEPARPDAQALTSTIRAALDEVTLQAERSEALHLSELAEALFQGDTDSLADSFSLRRRLLDGYHQLSTEHGPRLDRITRGLHRFHDACRALGLSPERLMDTIPSAGRVLSRAARHGLMFLVLGPLGILGVLTHTIPYLGVDLLAHRYAKGEDDMLSTLKVLASLLLFPLTWLLMALACAALWTWWAGLACFVLAPLTGLAALHLREEVEEARTATRALSLVFSGKGRVVRLMKERQKLKDDIFALEALLHSPRGEKKQV